VPEFTAPIGTRDVLPPQSTRWEHLVAVFADLAERAGYGLVQTPMFEDIGVFQRLGEGTDVVRKEMYVFDTPGGDRLALKPEVTASVVRAFVQHRPPTPWKVWTLTPCFRYERPQAGRYRQHHQVDVEAIGSADPDLDVEVLAVGHDYLQALGLRRVRLLVNSMGTADDRRRYGDALRAFLSDRLDALDPDDRAKVETNPMRVLDSKREATRTATADAPQLVDHLADDARERFEHVRAGLRSLDIEHEVEPRLVRGLDYYTHTTFEFVSDALDAAQSTVLGGGRYDGLVEEMGGPPTPGIGFGSGIERVLLACEHEGVVGEPQPLLDVWVVDVTDGTVARDLTVELRRTGVRADRAFDARSMKAQMKKAGSSGARLALIVGEQERADGTIAVRDLTTSGQDVVERDRVVEHVLEVLGR
jgi:histidyl-tRNA synthetase